MKVLSREGYELDTGDLVWELSRDKTVNLTWAQSSIGGALSDGFFSVISWYASNYAPGTALNVNVVFKKLITFLNIRTEVVINLSAIDLVNYRDSLSKTERYSLGTLVTLLRHWIKLEAPGVEKEVLKEISTWKEKASPKGVAVRTRCPKKGPLTQLEYEGLTVRLVQAFEDRAISLGSYVMADFLISTGRRPSQLGDLKAVDIKLPDEEVQEECGLVVLVPRKKQGGTWRSDFKAVYLTSEKAAPLLELVELNKRRFSKFWPGLSKADLDSVPLFPSWMMVRRAQDLPVAKVRGVLPRSHGHFR